MDGKENTDVQAAFELLNNTIDEERKRILAVGSQAMDRQYAEVAQDVPDFVKKLDAITIRRHIDNMPFIRYVGAVTAAIGNSR